MKATGIIRRVDELGRVVIPIEIRNKNKNVLTNEMATFIVLNTASIQIIPTTVIAIRNSLGSQNPTAIIFPVWVATIFIEIS